MDRNIWVFTYLLGWRLSTRTTTCCLCVNSCLYHSIVIYKCFESFVDSYLVKRYQSYQLCVYESRNLQQSQFGTCLTFHVLKFWSSSRYLNSCLLKYFSWKKKTKHNHDFFQDLKDHIFSNSYREKTSNQMDTQNQLIHRTSKY